MKALNKGFAYFFALMACISLMLVSCNTQSELVDNWVPGNLAVISNSAEGLVQILGGSQETVVIAEHGKNRLVGKEGSVFDQDSVSRRTAIQAAVSFRDANGNWHALDNCLVTPGTKKQDRVTFVPVLMPTQAEYNGWWLVDERILGDTPNVNSWRGAPKAVKTSYNEEDYTNEKNE